MEVIYASEVIRSLKAKQDHELRLMDIPYFTGRQEQQSSGFQFVRGQEILDRDKRLGILTLFLEILNFI